MGLERRRLPGPLEMLSGVTRGSHCRWPVGAPIS